MDIWEANKAATAVTPHPCTVTRQKRCMTPADCGEGALGDESFCDRPGCDMQTYRLGDPSFYGDGPTFGVDTSRPFTVVTRFVTEDGTDTGKLHEIRRHYMQDGKRIPSPMLPVGPTASFDSITDDFCDVRQLVSTLCPLRRPIHPCCPPCLPCAHPENL